MPKFIVTQKGSEKYKVDGIRLLPGASWEPKTDRDLHDARLGETLGWLEEAHATKPMRKVAETRALTTDPEPAAKAAPEKAPAEKAQPEKAQAKPVEPLKTTDVDPGAAGRYTNRRLTSKD